MPESGVLGKGLMIMSLERGEEESSTRSMLRKRQFCRVMSSQGNSTFMCLEL